MGKTDVLYLDRQQQFRQNLVCSENKRILLLVCVVMPLKETSARPIGGGFGRHPGGPPWKSEEKKKKKKEETGSRTTREKKKTIDSQSLGH